MPLNVTARYVSEGATHAAPLRTAKPPASQARTSFSFSGDEA